MGRVKSYMTGEEFQSAMRALKWNENDAALHLHVDRSTVNRYMNGAKPIKAPMAILINYIVHFGGLPKAGWRYGRPLFFKQHGA